MRNPLLSVVATIGLTVLVGGCNAAQRPTASYKSMSITDVTAKGFVMNVDVDVANPNAFALPLTNTDYGLKLGGSKLVENAKIKPAASSIPANGSGTVTIPVPLSFENLLTVAESIKK